MFRTPMIVSAVIVALASGRADAGPAFTYSANAGTSTGSTQSLGFDFKAATAISVTSLGIYAASTTSITTPQLVQIYDLNTSTVVAQASVVTSNPNTFNYAAIAPVTLNTSDTYAIYSTFLTNTSQYGTGTLTFDPSVINFPINGSNTGFGLPGQPPSQPFPNILAVNFQFTSGVVPEPVSIAMLGLGLSGMILARRKLAGAKVVA